MLPSFNWTSTDAPAMWSARKYSNIGSHELFSLTKQPFLALFSRPDTPDDDLNAFSEWLVVILIANQSGTSNYDLTPNEVRSVLRHAGPSTLSSFASHLAMTLRSARAEDRAWVWKKSVGPVFEGAWPLDVELQTAEATRQLVEMLLATGSAFGEAATTILPFNRPEDPRQYMSVYSISEANAELYGVAPEKMLDLLSAVAGGAADRTIYGLDKALDKLKEKAPQLVKEKKFQKLAAQAWVT